MLSNQPARSTNSQSNLSGDLPDPIKIIIADDHPLYRDGLTIAINAHDRMKVVYEASNGRQLLEAVIQYQPDIVLSDIKMPGLDGIQAVKQIVDLSLPTRCILLSQYDNDRLILEAINAGACGYLVKKASKAEIWEAILAAYAYRQYFCRFASTRLGHLISRSIYTISDHPSMPKFSEKEKQIISMLCGEKTSKEIGRELFMSGRTVEGYKAKIMNKMNTETTVGIVVYAIRHGFYNLDEPL